MNKKTISIFEIVLLVVAIFAFAYFAGEFRESLYDNGFIGNSNKSGKENERNPLFKNVNLLIFGFVEFFNVLEIIPSVAAQTPQEISDVRMLCCPRTTSGALCQDVPSTNSNLCEGGENSLSSTTCEYDSRCLLGCAVDREYGTCSPNSPKLSLNSEEWYPQADCNIPEEPQLCTKGCCILGDEAIFTTQQSCYYQAGNSGNIVNVNEDPFNSNIKTENECLAKVATTERGACVFSNSDSADGKNNCRATTQIECVQSSGVFYENKLCTSQELNTICKKSDKRKCIEGRDEVYFVDTCGNIANIYDASKVEDENYWDVLINKENSCQNSDGDSSCGNCNRFSGNTCSKDSTNNEEAYCKSLNCPASEKTGNALRLNGESWCVYESSIGNVDGLSVRGGDFASDVVGSRHYKRSCVNGEVKVEACQDYRGGICVQSIMEENVNGNNKKFSTASCKVNEALSCINYNFNERSTTDSEERVTEEEDLEAQKKIAELCNENKDCFLKNINVDEGFTFDMCLPKYPKGFDIKSESVEDSGSSILSEQLCALGNQKCVAVFEKELTGGWDCVYNCDCVQGGSPRSARPSQEFVNQMNEICVSLGDCGSYVNIAGEGSVNAQANTRKKTIVGWEQYKNFATPVAGQYAEADSLDEIIENLGIASITGEGEFVPEENKIEQAIKIGGTISGALGTTIAFTNSFTTFGINDNYGGALSGLSSFATFASGVGLGITAGSLIGKIFGLQGDALVVMAVAGAVAGGVIAGFAIAAGQTFWAFCAAAWMACLGAIIFLVLLAFALSWLGIGDTKEVNVEFTCLPWQAPTGGSNCEKCQENPELFPCTEYRCESLGATCILLNEDAANAICVESNPYDNAPPLISAGEILVGSEGNSYEFQNEIEHESVKIINTDDNANDKCIKEFEFVPFTLETDEYAQCKFGFENSNTYEDMDTYTYEGTRYTLNHTLNLFMPSLDSLSAYDIELREELRQKFANVNLYVKCQDQHGNFNLNSYLVNFCVEDGPDLTAPRILSTVPTNGASLKYGTEEKEVVIFINEPAECKYGDVKSTSYEEMANTMECNTELTSGSGRGWQCSTNLTNLQQGENKFFIKCKDQPWLDDANYAGEREGRQRNVNDGYEYILKVSENELRIDSITPTNGSEIVRGYAPYVTLDLEVETSGGVDDEGVAECSYRLSENREFIGMLNTFSDSHKQPGLSFGEGTHNIEVRCEDSVGNFALEKTSFKIRIDDEAPIVVRVLHRNGLEIITNEEAECKYSTSSCDFVFDSAESNVHSMTNVLDTTHTAPWNKKVTYYIKCKDLYGNKNGNECGIIASPGDEFLNY